MGNSGPEEGVRFVWPAESTTDRELRYIRTALERLATAAEKIAERLGHPTERQMGD